MKLDEIKQELNRSWVNSASWECVELRLHNEQLQGEYLVNLHETESEIAPHKLIVHGTDTNIMGMYHSVVHSLYAFKDGVFSASQLDIDTPFSELRRRVIIVETNLRFKKAIFSEKVSLKSTITKQVDKGQLFFYDIHIDVGDGCQIIENKFCLNFRDELIK